MMVLQTVSSASASIRNKRVKIVSVGPDGKCLELAKAHIPQGTHVAMRLNNVSSKCNNFTFLER